MNGFWTFLIVLAYLAALQAVATSSSAWVAADRAKVFWVLMLAIPYLNVFGLVTYVVGVLPVLLPAWSESLRNPLRRGGIGGHATRHPLSG